MNTIKLSKVYAGIALVLIVGFALGAVSLYAVKARINKQALELKELARSDGRVTLTGGTGSKIDISGWKTYRNEEYGFEFMGPAGIVERASSDKIFYDMDTKVTGRSVWNQIFNVEISDRTVDSLAEEILNDVTQIQKQDPSTEIKILFDKTILFANGSARRIDVYSPIGVSSALVLVRHKEKTFKIEGGGSGTESEKVFLTFKFIE